MNKRLILCLTLLLAFAAAGQASASTATAWRGVVVAKDVKQGTVVTASPTGAARTVHTAKARALRLGQRLDVRATALADGTFRALSLEAAGRAKKARLKAVVVRNQSAQRRLLVSAGGSTFALRRAAATRALASAGGSGLKAGDRIDAAVTLTPTTVQATSVTTVGRLGALEVEGVLTKIAPDSIELVVAKSGYVTLALPAGFSLPAGIAVFDEVEVLAAVGTDGKLIVLAIKGEDDDEDHGVDAHDDGEIEVEGTISALSPTSISVVPGRSATAVTCALRAPLTGFEVGDVVEIECVAATDGSLVLKEIEHEDDDEDDDDDDDHEDDDGPGGNGHG